MLGLKYYLVLSQQDWKTAKQKCSYFRLTLARVVQTVGPIRAEHVVVVRLVLPWCWSDWPFFLVICFLLVCFLKECSPWDLTQMDGGLLIKFHLVCRFTEKQSNGFHKSTMCGCVWSQSSWCVSAAVSLLLSYSLNPVAPLAAATLHNCLLFFWHCSLFKSHICKSLFQDSKKWLHSFQTLRLVFLIRCF